MFNKHGWHTYKDSEFGFMFSYSPKWTFVDRSVLGELTISSETGAGIHLSRLQDTSIPLCDDVLHDEVKEGSDTYPTACVYIKINQGNSAVLIDSESSTGTSLYEVFFPSPSGTWIMAPTHLATKEELIRVVKSIRFLMP